MVKIPSLSRRPETAPTRDENRDGRIDGRDERLAAERTGPVAPTSPAAGGNTARAASRSNGDTGAHSIVTDRTVGPDRTDPPAVTPDAERTPDVVVDRGPRPRASLLATISLILGVVGVLFVLTGTLAGYGIGVGAVGALLAVGGLAATRRRHVAGTTESFIGLVLGLAAVVIGILALTGQFDWPNTHGDAVQRFREWLDAQFVNRFGRATN